MVDKILLDEDENNIIIASCRTSYLNHTLQEFGSELINSFYQIEIKPIDEKIRQEVQKQTREHTEFKDYLPDDTIGSYFIPLNAMNSRYLELKKHRENDDISLIQFEFLRSYKCVDIWKRRNRGSKDIIIEYTTKRLIDFYNKNLNITPFEWKKTIDKLIELGFVSNEGDKVSIEPAYLERIIANDESEEAIAFEIVKYYFNQTDIAKLIYRVSSADLAWKLYEKAKELNFLPNSFILNSLIIKVKDEDKRKIILSDFQKFSICFDTVTYNVFISEKKNYQEARKIYEEMISKQIEPNARTVNNLLRYNRTFDDAWAIYHEFSQRNIEIAENSFYSLLGRCESFSQALNVFKAFCSVGYKPNSKFFNSVFSKLTKSEQNNETIYNEGTLYVHQKMCESGVLHSPHTLHQLIVSCPSFDIAWGIFQEIKEQQKIERLSPTVFTALMTKAETFEQANQAFQKMLNINISFNRRPVNKLIEKASDFETAWSIFEQIPSYGVEYDEHCFKVLINKANSIAEREKVIGAAHSYFPTIVDKLDRVFIAHKCRMILYSMRRSQSFSDRWKNYQEFEIWNIKPDEKVFYLLLGRCENFSQALSVFKAFCSVGYKPNSKFFNSVFSKLTKSEQNNETIYNEGTLYVHQKMCKSGVLHSPHTLHQLIVSCPSFDIAWGLFKAIKEQQKIERLSPTVFTALMTKAETFEQANQAFQKMLDLNISFNCRPINKLIEKAPDFEKAWCIFEKIPNYGVEYDKFSFEVLICKANSIAEKNKIIAIAEKLYPGNTNNLHLKYTKNKVRQVSREIRLCQLYDDAEELYFELAFLEIIPERHIFDAMIYKITCTKHILKLLGFYILADYKPDFIFFEKILNRISNYYKYNLRRERDVYLLIEDLMSKYKIEHSHYTLSLIINNSPNFNEAWNLYLSAKKDKRISRYSPTIFTNLIKKAKTYQQAVCAYEEMLETQDIALNCYPFNTLMRKTPDFDTAWMIFKQMLSYEVEYDNYTFNVLIYKAKNFNQENTVVEYARNNNLEIVTHLNQVIFKKRRKGL